MVIWKAVALKENNNIKYSFKYTHSVEIPANSYKLKSSITGIFIDVRV